MLRSKDCVSRYLDGLLRFPKDMCSTPVISLKIMMNVAHLPTDEHDVKIDSPRSVTMIGGVDCTSMGLTSSGGVQIMQPAESSPPLLLDISADRCSEALADDHPTVDQAVNAEERVRGTLLEERWSDVVGELSLATHWYARC
nr:hypothetical protein CFP56_38799 [Quercus suber]